MSARGCCWDVQTVSAGRRDSAGAHRQQRGADKGDDVAGAPARPQNGHLLQELCLLLRPLVDQPLDGDRGQPVAPPDHHPKGALAQLHLSAILIKLNLQRGSREVSTSHLLVDSVSSGSQRVHLHAAGIDMLHCQAVPWYLNSASCGRPRAQDRAWA